MKLKLLDLFCGAGGCSKGYHDAGFDDITGIDIAPQSHYPYKFIQADALEYLAEYGHEYDFIHASPPCQSYTWSAARWNKVYPDLLGIVEKQLVKLGIPFVIENVEQAPFTLPTVTLCGTQFGLGVIRHRKFASSFMFFGMYHAKRHPLRGEFVTVAGHGGNGSSRYSVWCDAMKIDWMTKQELTQAIPPAYTEYIGRQYLLQHEALP